MPTFDPKSIRAVIAMLEDPKVDIATLAAPIANERDKNDPAVVKVVTSGEGRGARALSFSRQMPVGNAYQHIGLYVYRREALEKFVSLPQSPLEKKEKLEQLRAMEAGMTIGVAIIDEAPVGVDTPETLEQARKAYG